jgi:hypothetical protein
VLESRSKEETMTAKLVRIAIVGGAAIAAGVVLFAAPAQALPAGPRGADCARFADNMAYYADMAHVARMRHDIDMWNVYQLEYENEWWKYQDAGC